MSTVDREIAEELIAGKYPEDHAVKIVKYENAWGNEAFGVVFKGQNLDMYRASEYVINPRVYWTVEGGKENA